MSRVAMHVPPTESGVVFDPIKEPFQMMKMAVELDQVRFEVQQMAFVVSDVMDVSGKTHDLRGVHHEVSVLRRVAIVNCFIHQLAGSSLNPQSQRVDVIVNICLRWSGCQRGH